MESAVEITAVLRRAADYCSVDVACAGPAGGEGEEGDEEGGEGVASRLSIRAAMVSLEEQLASLQDLQQQQQYEREAVLSEINTARKFLLQKLMDYKGAYLEVIHEASAFAIGTTLTPPIPGEVLMKLKLVAN